MVFVAWVGDRRIGGTPLLKCVALIVLYSFLLEGRPWIFLLVFFFDLGRCKDACRWNPRWFTINWCSSKPFSHSKHTQVFSSPSVYLKVEEGTTISPQPHKMVFHKVSPTISILLSVLLLFLSQETLSRELIQVAPYGKYFSSFMISWFLVMPSTFFTLTCKIHFWFGFLQKIKLYTWMAGYLQAAPHMPLIHFWFEIVSTTN